MNLLQIETELALKYEELSLATKKYAEFKEKKDTEIKELLRNKNMSMNNIDLEKVKIAESLLQIRGLEYDEYNERCINEAIKDIVNDTNKMSREYFGAKNYEGWRHQECDCKYGYGPTHGSIVFSIGLQKPKEKLNEEQKECCLYYLNLLRDKTKRQSLVKAK